MEKKISSVQTDIENGKLLFAKNKSSRVEASSALECAIEIQNAKEAELKAADREVETLQARVEGYDLAIEETASSLAKKEADSKVVSLLYEAVGHVKHINKTMPFKLPYAKVSDSDEISKAFRITDYDSMPKTSTKQHPYCTGLETIWILPQVYLEALQGTFK